MNQYKWVGPSQIKELLRDVIPQKLLPDLPEKGSAYLVTQKKWDEYPTSKSVPLYVGGNSGKSSRFRTRVGDLVCDTFGFFGEETGHHSGGKSLNGWCRENEFDPLSLYVGWIASCTCHRCLENDLFGALTPALNRMRPTRCPIHIA